MKNIPIRVYCHNRLKNNLKISGVRCVRKVDHDSRREEVASVASRLIADRGLEALTTRALAKELGCSIGVLSHYFNSKEEIVMAAFQWADQRIDQRMQDAIADLEEISLRTIVKIPINYINEKLKNKRNLWPVIPPTNLNQV